MAWGWFRKDSSSNDINPADSDKPVKKLSNSSFARALKQALGQGVDANTWEQIEEVLLLADVGMEATSELIERAKSHRPLTTAEVESALRLEMLELLGEPDEISLELKTKPAVILMVGVNGTGKTTSTGKLANQFVLEGKIVVLGAADTFRAAAANQLATWAERSGSTLVRGPEGADPAAVAYDAVSRALELNADVVLIDTAGRLHTKTGLMDELGKVRRVIERQAEISEVLLVLDATTGQNGLIQAKVFADAVNLTGIVLTKLDGSAKGGIVFAVKKAVGVPVKFVGLGESIEDLVKFNPTDFVEAIFD
jgi:fused signal recognition particle receptor